MRNTA